MPSWTSRLLHWYAAHRRELPWRGHPDPYAVWISEIMLQQTRITTVRPYFQRFLARFPSVGELAHAPLADVLKQWEGLGCYRYLGWGDDFRQPRARRKLAAWLQPALTASATPGDLNQALMELGERLCLPRTPACTPCPLAATCHACQTSTQANFPCRPKPRAIPTRHASAVILRRRHRWLLVQRPANGLLGGFWELPGGESPQAADARMASAAVRRQTGLTPVGLTYLGAWEHRFTHFLLHLQVYASHRATGRLASPEHGARAQWVSPDEMSQLPVSTLHRRVLTQRHPQTTASRANQK